MRSITITTALALILAGITPATSVNTAKSTYEVSIFSKPNYGGNNEYGIGKLDSVTWVWELRCGPCSILNTTSKQLESFQFTAHNEQLNVRFYHNPNCTDILSPTYTTTYNPKYKKNVVMQANPPKTLRGTETFKVCATHTGFPK